MPPTLRGVLFDMGGPVCRTPFEMARRLERVTGAPPGAFAWTGPFDPAADALWQRMQSTEITEREYWHIRAREAAPYTGDESVVTLFQTAFADPDESIRPQAMDFLARCRAAGMRSGILTNDMKDFNEPGWSDRVPFVQQVDFVVDGSITGALKPDPRAYAIAIETMGFAPDEIMMIDDQPFNIEGAARAGLQTCWFDVTDPDGSYERASRIAGLQ
ncbi:MAG: HAD-IA family hydrolase [Candidatus Nanopelagicales bacterium]|jgi:putative hydrolase of the HAD superfamily